MHQRGGGRIWLKWFLTNGEWGGDWSKVDSGANLWRRNKFLRKIKYFSNLFDSYLLPMNYKCFFADFVFGGEYWSQNIQLYLNILKKLPPYGLLFSALCILKKINLAKKKIGGKKILAENISGKKKFWQKKISAGKKIWQLAGGSC